MKLIHKTYLRTSVWILPIMLIGSIFCFFMIEHIAYEETDEFLTYEMERIIEYHKEYDNLPDFNRVADILPGTYYSEAFFKDTLLLESGDNEMVPYRELRFSIVHNNEYVGIVLHHLLLGRDDIAEGTLLIIVGIMLLVSMFLIIIINHVSGKLWKPFYSTLTKLRSFELDKPVPSFEKTDVYEFSSLNIIVYKLLQKISSDYNNNKEFNENASHELQTHLSIIRAHTEKIINNRHSEEFASQLNKIYTASRKLSHIQKSLLLLSKINNGEFHENRFVRIHEILQQTITNFSEAITIRHIQINSQISPCTVNMNEGLAEILVNNIVKNAIKH